MKNIEKLINFLKEKTKDLPPPMVTTIKQRYPNNVFLILISCLLSLRSRDTVTLPVCLKLFSKYKTPQDFAKANIIDIESIIKPTGFYHQKAKTLKLVSQEIIDKFNGKVPNNYQDLISLPGVGPKTANLVLGEGFDIPAICVDTHVHRLSNHLGIVHTKTPEETLKKLEKILPIKYWIDWNRILVTWGQFVCKPNSKCVCPKIN